MRTARDQFGNTYYVDDSTGTVYFPDGEGGMYAGGNYNRDRTMAFAKPVSAPPAPTPAPAPAPVSAASPQAPAKPLWISASDPYFAQFNRVDEFGGYENPYSTTIAGLQTPEMWGTVARQLGFTGQQYERDPETGAEYPSQEFQQFIAQKKAEGYDFVVKGDEVDKRTSTFGLKTPTGEVVGQRPVKAAGFGEFFKEFLLPAGFAAFTMGGGLNALAGGGAGAGAGANALAGIAEGMVPGGLTAAGIPATAAELSAVGALTGGGLTLADIPTSGLSNVLGSGADAATGAGGAVEAGGAATAPVDPEMAKLLRQGEIAQAGGSVLGGIGANAVALPLVGATGSATGIPVLDKAIDFVTSPGGAAIVSGASNIIGGIAGANAAENAAETQAAAADRATALQREMYEKALELNRPYYEAGVNALGKLTRGEILPEPGYAFRLGEGMKALERVQAARGNMLSGGALKAGQRYAQDLASQEYGNAYNRLANIAGLGQTATTQAGTAGQNYASQAGELGLQGANALAQGRIGRQTSYTNALLGAAGALQDYAQAPMKEQMFRDIYGRLMGKP